VFVGFSDTAGAFTSQVNSAGVMLEGVSTLAYPNAHGRIASVNKPGTGASSLTETTNRFCVVRYLSSIGGQYGGVCAQAYDEAGHVTLSSSAFNVFTAQTTYHICTCCCL